MTGPEPTADDHTPTTESHTPATGSHTPATEITFAHASEPPTSDVTVYASLTREFLGTQATFEVIGSSHRVAVPALEFYEMSSCAPVENATGTEIPLTTDGERREITHETDRLRCVTTVDRLPLAAFDEHESFDLAYRFGPDAVTTVDVGDRQFETYHTYPEHDLAVYSRTVFERVASDGRGANK